MLKENLIEIFERDINKLRNEISLYKSESALWAVEGDIKNCGGNLCLHLIGNLREFIGRILGGVEYTRDRDKEFSLKGVSQAALLEGVDAANEAVKTALDKLNKDDFKKIYPIDVVKNNMTTEYFLLSLLGHLNYHLGQINYHRRLIDK